MTGHQVTSFVSDLMEMAKAVEMVPQLQSEIAAFEDITQSQHVTIASLQADLEASRRYSAALEQAKHDLEVARDDAELRFLEASDRTDRALAFVRSVFGNAGQVIQSLEPPRAESAPLTEEETTAAADWINGPAIVDPPVPVSVTPDPTSAPTGDQSSVAPPTPETAAAPSEPPCQTDFSGEHSDPTVPSNPYDREYASLPFPPAAPATGPGTTPSSVGAQTQPSFEPYEAPPASWGDSASPLPSAVADTAPTPDTASPTSLASSMVGESATDPTAVDGHTETGDSAASIGAPKTSDASPNSTMSSCVVADPALPYAGLLYCDYPGYVSRYHWLAGGGTDASYDHRRDWRQA